MELYLLNNLFRRERLIDNYESLIWTDRVDSFGDFKLVVFSTPTTRATFITGMNFSINLSYHVMVSETVVDEEGEDGERLLTITGRSLEAYLEDRITESLKFSEGNYVVENETPGGIARHFFYFTIAAKTGNESLPISGPSYLYPVDTVPEPAEKIVSYTDKYGMLYDALKNVCAPYNLGFRLVLNPSTNKIHFDVYSGVDRTTAQTKFPPVIFSPQLDTLRGVTTLFSQTGYKNIARVFNPGQVPFYQNYSVEVYSNGGRVEAQGFNRRYLIVILDAIPDVSSQTTPETQVALWRSLLTVAGRQALSKHNKKYLVDGEVPQNGAYTHGKDYNVGDRVEIRNSDGESAYQRVIEQIFISDVQGERSYPTLASIA